MRAEEIVLDPILPQPAAKIASTRPLQLFDQLSVDVCTGGRRSVAAALRILLAFIRAISHHVLNSTSHASQRCAPGGSFFAATLVRRRPDMGFPPDWKTRPIWSALLADYELTRALPQALATSLPSIEALEAELATTPGKEDPA